MLSMRPFFFLLGCRWAKSLVPLPEWIGYSGWIDSHRCGTFCRLLGGIPRVCHLHFCLGPKLMVLCSIDTLNHRPFFEYFVQGVLVLWRKIVQLNIATPPSNFGALRLLPGNVMLYVKSTTTTTSGTPSLLPQQHLLGNERVRFRSTRVGTLYYFNNEPPITTGVRIQTGSRVLQGIYLIRRLGILIGRLLEGKSYCRSRTLVVVFDCFCGRSNGALVAWAQIFHDQISASMNDHQLGPKVPRP
jgi:hypothetical protein